MPFETGDFYIELFLLAIKPSSLREGPEGLMSIFPGSVKILSQIHFIRQ